MRWFSRYVLGGCLLFLANLGWAADGYELTGKPGVNRADNKIEVVEFFWYGCPHCYSFEPVINEWKEKGKADYVVFRREAPALSSRWEPHSRAFYAAELMNVSDTLHEPLFKAIHEDNKRLDTPESLADFAATLGIDRDRFLSTMSSFAVDGRLSQARRLAMDYGLTGVPAIVIHGKYRTGGSTAGSYERLIEVINELTQKEYEAASVTSS